MRRRGDASARDTVSATTQGYSPAPSASRSAWSNCARVGAQSGKVCWTKTAFSTMQVRMKPGLTVNERMPKGRNSWSSALDYPSSACSVTP